MHFRSPGGKPIRQSFNGEKPIEVLANRAFVIDGAKALRAGIERVFGERAEVQRCQIHKRRNVKEHLPQSAQGDTDRRIRNAYAMTDYTAAKAELEKIFRQLERINPSAARSLQEGLEETLTVHRLGVGTLLRRTLASINPIESCLSTVERVTGNVKRWRAGDHALRWTATGLLERFGNLGSRMTRSANLAIGRNSLAYGLAPSSSALTTSCSV